MEQRWLDRVYAFALSPWWLPVLVFNIIVDIYQCDGIGVMINTAMAVWIIRDSLY
jgi:uncharacterized membrane protein